MNIKHEFLLKDGETQSQYIFRMCSCRKDNNLTWDELAQICNQVLQIPYSESWYRKNWNKGALVPETTTCENRCNDSCDVTSPDCYECSNFPECVAQYSDELKDQEDRLNSLLRSIKNQRFKLADESSQNKAYMRRLSREETIKDIAHDYASVMNSTKILTPVNGKFEKSAKNRSGILLLSDWHYGMVCNNSFNVFDPDICKQRVSKLLNEVISLAVTNQLEEIVVMNLSDLIAGRIHSQIRIESRFDVITQTMEVAEILAEFLTDLSSFVKVRYGDVLDNHSRLEPNKKESMSLETLVRIIPWYLKERLSVNKRIQFIDNEFGLDILTCEIQGHNVIGVHGDHDRPVTALDKLTLMTHRHYDLLCIAHYHHFSCDEKNQSLIISNGTLMGTDTHSEELRLTSDPSQTFIIVTPENVAYSIHRIILK